MSYSMYGMARVRAKKMLRDRCIIQRWTAGATNTYNYKGKATYVDSDERPCNFVPGGGGEAQQLLMQVTLETGLVYLAPTEVVSNRDRILITRRNKRVLSQPMPFQVLGDPEEDATLLKVHLKAVVEKV